MELIQEIGSYAGLAAILGLAVLSALYFSQARDVRRLRDWAGRAPERTTEPAAQPTRVVARPVPRPPGAQGTQTGLQPVSGGLVAPPGAAPAASSTGAAPAAAIRPAVATPAGARGAGAAAPGEVSQDTASHPPPSRSGDGGEQPASGDAPGEQPGPDDAPGGQATDDAPRPLESQTREDDDERAPDDEAPDRSAEEQESLEDQPEGEQEDAFGAPPAEEHWDDEDFDEQTDDRPAVGPPLAAGAPARPVRPLPRPPAMPSRGVPATPAGARPAGVPSRPAGPSPPVILPPSANPVILPPYERSRPGGDAWYRGLFYSPARAALVIGLGVLVLAGATLAGLRLAGSDEEPASQATDRPGADQTADNGAAGGGQADGNDPRAPVDPADVTVSVLNGTTITGLASKVGDTVEAEGYQLGTVTNSTDQTRAESVVFYAEGAEAEAEDVSRRLDIPQRETIDATTQGVAGDATVVVVVGADKS